MTPFLLLLEAETAAARLEGHLAATSEIGALWRAEVAVGEAVSSVGMEDVRISEVDLLSRISGNGLVNEDTRALEDALGLYRFFRAPGSFPADVDLMADRLNSLLPENAGRVTSSEILTLFGDCPGRLPILEALRAAARFGIWTERRAPIAERVVFMFAEHVARGGALRSRVKDDEALRGLSGPVAASWLIPPASALSRRGLHIWSPMSKRGITNFLHGAGAVLRQDLGRIIALRTWVEQKEALRETLRASSRAYDAACLFGKVPILTATGLADALGITPRGAINVMGALQDAGLISEITGRSTSRIWATPGIAAQLAARRETAAERRAALRRPRAETPNDPAATSFQENNEGLRETALRSMDDAFAEFEASLKEFDEIMARINGKS